LLRLSLERPLLLVFEDLHWIDSETQAVLDEVIEALPAARILLLVNFRPEYPNGWGGRTYYTQLPLEPLGPEAAEALLGELLGAGSPGESSVRDGAAEMGLLRRLLLARTEGNPLFLEESVRALIETGVLVGERGAYRLTRAPSSIEVPATVQAVLAARIDRLPPGEKRLLQSAAVIGEDVPLALLQAIADQPEEDLRVGLAHLPTRRTFPRTRSTPSSMP
jgi:predicted ATPase